MNSSKKNVLIISLFILLALTAKAQPLRKSVLSLATGYVSGDNSLSRNNSSQVLFWGNYAFSTLDEISAVYKKFSYNNSQQKYNETFFAIKTNLNFFPFYVSASYGGLSGTFTPRNSYPDAKATFYAGDVTYYNNLFFYRAAAEYVSIDWQSKENVVTVEGDITWRPTKYFYVMLGGNHAKSDSGYSFSSVSYEIFWQPVNFFNVTFKKYFGKHRFYYDADYMIMYNFPFTEQGAQALYLRFYPWKTLSVIFNYERREYELFSVEYYSISLRYDFIF